MKFRFRDISAKTALAASGLTLMTGLAAAPAAAADHAPPQHSAAHSAAVHTAAGTKTNPANLAANQPSDKPAGKPAPGIDKLIGQVQGEQQRFTPNAEQLANTRAVVAAAQQMNLPDRAAVIAVATGLQESKLENLGHLGDRNDHDSLGLFQQRPSSGWGTPEQITDPTYSAKAFYQGLKQVDGYERMPLTQAAQTVQVSAYPDAYAKWEQMAAELVLATYGAGPYAHIK